MKKRIAVSVLALVLGGSLFAGGGGQKPAAKPKVVMTISNQQNEFIVGMGNSFKTVGAEHGYDVQLLDAQVDPTKQLAQIESAITQGAAAIFLEPCSYDGLTSGLRLAKEAGIPVFTIHNGVSATELITSAIYVNVRQGGSLKMQKCMDDIKGTGDIAIMTGTIGQDTTNQIVGGYEEVLAKYPGVNVVFTGSGNWGATDAAPLAENWIASGRRLDAIVCNNDGMALGVLPVLKTTGNVGKIRLYGLDATPEGLKAVKAGEMTATIYVDAHAEIVKAFELLSLIRQGKKVDPEYIIPAVLVDSSNVDKYIK
jgi:ribose transport system substrate-binding protein/inositol transport system substrate-binding protein